MEKAKIAVLAGGYSGESVISMKSVKTVLDHLDTDRYEVYKIIIERNRWYASLDDGREIEVDKNDFTIHIDSKKISFDGAFIVIHGTPGEDGKLQGYFDMIGLKYSTCNDIVSALTFNKSFCNQVVKNLGVARVANSVHLFINNSYSIGAILEKVKLPLFVKPNESGSSLGVSKVLEVESLQKAIDKAFTEDNEVLVEEYIEGRELTIGAFLKNGEVIILPPTEIISKNEFFDYEAKYTTGVTDEITPAQIPESLLEELQAKTRAIYTGLGCRGVVRVDYIWERNSGELYFLEVNTMPGQSENSLIPQQAKAYGFALKEFYGILVEEMLKS